MFADTPTAAIHEIITEEITMKCPICAAENPDNAAFCGNCGSRISQEQPIDQPQPEPAAKKSGFADLLKANKKLIAIGAGVLVVLILIICVCASLSGGSSSSGDYLYAPQNSVRVLHIDDELKILLNGKYIDGPLDTENGYFVTSLDYSTSILLTYNDNYDYDSAYLITEKGLKKIADDVINAKISDNGKVAAVLTDDYMLYSVELPSCKMTKIRLCDEDTPYSIRMSPNGKCMLYRVDGELWFHKDGAEDYMIADSYYTGIALSDGGKYIYIRNTDNDAIYMTKANDPEKVKLAPSGGSSVQTNADRSEILFCTDDDKAYICVKGGEKVKLLESQWCSPLYPDGTTAVKTFIGIPLTYDTSDDCGMFYISKKLEAEKIAKGVDSEYSLDYAYGITGVRIYPTVKEIVGDTLYYTKSGKLYMSSASEGYEPEKIASDVINFAVTKDGKHVYYIDEENTLWCYTGGDPKKIADDVYRFNFGTFGSSVFFLTDYADYTGTLYSCSDGKNKTRIADEVIYVEYNSNEINYFVVESREDASCSFYTSADGKKFTCILYNYEI